MALQESRSPGHGFAAHGRVAAVRDAFARPVLARLLVVFFLAILAFSGMETTFAWWAIAQFGWGPRPIGFVFFYCGLLLALMQGVLIGPFTRRIGEERLMLAGLGLIAIGLVALPFARALPPLLFSVSALSLGMGAMQPSLNSLISRRAGADQQGEVLGVAQSVTALSRVLGPFIAGALSNLFAPVSPFLAGPLLVGCALLIPWPLPPPFPPPPPPPPPNP